MPDSRLVNPNAATRELADDKGWESAKSVDLKLGFGSFGSASRSGSQDCGETARQQVDNAFAELPGLGGLVGNFGADG